MNKAEFLRRLKRELRCVQRDERDKNLSFYAELIDDKIEEGMNEAEAIEGLGDINTIALSLIQNARDCGKIIKKHSKMNTAMIVIGSPLWVCCIAVAFAVLVALYCVLWSVVVAIGCCIIGLMVGGSCGLALGIANLAQGFEGLMLFMSVSVALIGVGLLLMIPYIQLIKLCSRLSAYPWRRLSATLKERKNKANENMD